MIREIFDYVLLLVKYYGKTKNIISFFFVGDLFRYYNYEKDYKDDSITDNTTCLMRIYA